MSAARKRVGDEATGRRSDQSLGLNPTDKVVIAYLIIISFLVIIFSFRIEWWGWFLALHAILITLVSLLARNSRPFYLSPPLVASSLPRPVATFIRSWYPIALIPITYKELSYLIPRIHPRDFDSTLAAIDHRIFGVHPTVWLDRFTWPALTELLQITYSSYYFLPVILGAVLWRKGWIDRFHLCVFALVFGFYLSYLGYIAVPAIGPRFLPSIIEAQTKPLMGVLFFHAIRDTLDRAEGITRDCFPSGHTELTLLVLYYARRFHRRTFWWLLPFGSGIIISTVYLRYHYVIDVIAGALLAVVVVVIAKPLYRRLAGKDLRKGM